MKPYTAPSEPPMMKERRGRTLLRNCLLIGLMAGCAIAQTVPDLTNGGVPSTNNSTNLGPTGMRGWMYHKVQDSSLSRQIKVYTVDAGSPAAGIMAPDDVILGASGTAAAPANFTYDARRSFADAINDAEARTPATLKILRWRAGVTETVEITLQTMGAYSATAPYNCPKSALILEQGLAAVMAGETSGLYGFGILSLLAAYDPADPDNAARMARAEAEVLALIPNQSALDFMMTATSLNAGSPWERGHALIVFCEYFLLTGDTRVLPAIRAYAICLARNQTLFGGMGHKFTDPWPDGSVNGPMGAGYGPINNSSLTGWLGLILAKKCGLTDPEIDPAIERADRFFAYYTDKGAIPYGEHTAYVRYYESNGKMSQAALAFGLLPHRAAEARHFTRMSVTSAPEREIGHTGAFFNYLWAPLGAAAGGPDAAAFHFAEIRWMLDLNRSWNGLFIYDCLNGEGQMNGLQYGTLPRFRMSTAALLTYALPLRNLTITGKNPDPAKWLTPAELTDSEAALEYQAAGRSVSELITDLSSWSTVIRRNAADQILSLTANSATIDQLTAIATDTNADRGARVEACYILGNMNDEATAGARATTLVGLLTDSENYVRFMSAEAMRSISNGYRLPHLNTILEAAASLAKPLLPLDDEDPMHLAHGRLCVLLFSSTNGVLAGSNVNLAPKHLLYPAIKATARHPYGSVRGSLSSVYDHLSEEDMRVISGPVVDAARDRSPADRMHSPGGRVAALKFLKRFDLAEGVPVALAMMRDDGDTNAGSFVVLEQYAGGSTTVVPDPDVEGFMRELIAGGISVDSAQQVLDAIAADSNPTPLDALKSIQSVTADSPSINLPSLWTTLRVNSIDYAEGDSVYTWRKIHGAGNVTFAPNGTGDSNNAVALFDGTPGQYLFEVTMSDSRGLTEESETVAVTLNNSGGTLPANSPPVANNQSPTVLRAIPTLISLTGTDPEGYPLTYRVITHPAHGKLTGDAPNLTYTPDLGYLGADSFTFEVMDSEGQVSSPATVSITISENAGIPAAIYEPFDYPVGNLNGASGTSETGFSAPWFANHSSSLVTGASLSYGSLPQVGGSIATEGAASLGGNRAISPDALANYGLLDDGSTLWFSVLIGAAEGSNMTNAKAGFSLANSGFNGGNSAITNEGQQLGSGLGVFLGRVSGVDGTIIATQFRDPSYGSLDAPNVYGNRPPSTTKIRAGEYKFVVGKITWGATGDTLEMYFPDEDMNLGAVQSTLTVAVDQSAFDTLTWNKVGTTLLDEIRFGPTYHSVLAGNAPMAADTAAPAPVPMAFHQVPTPTSTSAIRMEAVPVLDTSGVEYYFTCTAGGGNDSGWQSSPIYTATGLAPGVLYSYTVKARDNSPALNETAPSPALSATISAQATLPDFTGMTRVTAESIIATLGMNLGTVTLVNDPNLLEGTVTGQSPAGQQTLSLGTTVNLTAVGPDITAPNPNPASFASAPAAVDFFSITMTATTGTDPAGVQYLFTETSGNPGGTSSGWQDSPVYTDGGLQDGTQYTYTVTLRDKSPNANATTPSAPASATTPELPDPIVAYWDGGNGSWGDVEKWSTVSGATTPDPTTVPDFVDTAIFNTTSGGSTLQDVALDGNRFIQSLIYRSGTPHIVANTSGTTPRTLSIGGGGITINNTVGGNFEIGRSASTLGAVNIALTADQNWTNNDDNRMTVNGSISGNYQITKNGAGTISLNGANSYTGGLVINAGSVSSTITFNDSFLGSAIDAKVTVNAGGTLSLNRNNITGTLTMNGGNVTSSNGFGSTWNGSIVLQSTSLFMNGGAGSITLNAVISGPGGFSRTSAGNDTRVLLKSANTFTGDTVWAVSNARLELDHALALQNSTLDTANSLVSAGGVERGIRTTVPTLTLGGLSGNKDLKSLFATNATAGGYNNLTRLTLNPGAGKTPTYTGVIVNGAATMALTKTGLGTQTLSGNNTYTGTTTVSEGTLALVGGSHTSPITVAGGAALGFTIGSPTTSTSSVDFGSGTVTITGTPTLESYTLMTADGGFTGAPVLSEPLPGYSLTIDGTQLKLVNNNAPLWVINPITEADAAKDAAYSATLADDASDADNDPLTFAKVSGPGWLSIAPDGTLSGTPTQSNLGLNNFTVSVTDGIVAPVEATLIITVVIGNEAPVFTANPINKPDATEDEPYAATLAGSATDANGDPLTYAKVSGPAWLCVAPDGTLSGTPLEANVGANSFTVSASDGIAPAVTATLNITVIEAVAPVPNIFTWASATSGNWSVPASWTNNLSDGTAPIATGLSSYTLNFPSGTYTTTHDLNGGFLLNKANFSGAVTLSGTNGLTFTSDGATPPALNHNSASNMTVSAPIIMADDLTIGGTGTGRLFLSGGVSGGGKLIKDGSSRVDIQAANSYTGGTWIKSGSIVCLTAGLDTFLGQPGTIDVTVENGGTLTMSKNTITGTLRLNGGTLSTSNSFASNWSGTIILGNGSTSTVNNGSTGGMAISAEISGSGNLLKAGTSSPIALHGESTFTGKVFINAGALSVASLNSISGGTPTSKLGAPITVENGTISLGSGNSGGNLIYTGTGETTDRVIALTGTTGGATLTQGGNAYLPTTRGQSGLLKFTSDLLIPGTADADNRKTLTLNDRPDINTGGTTGRGEISGSIGDSLLGNPGQTATSIVKSGVPTWTLSGANTYTGSTQVQAGTLAFTRSDALGSGPLDISTGAKVSLDYIGTRQVSALTFNAGSAQPAGTYGSSESLATFQDDTRFSGPGTITVGPLSSTSVALALSSGATPSIGGTPVTFTATVTGSTPTGTVEFYDGLSLIGTGTLNGAFETSLTTNVLTDGSHAITAVYPGDANNGPGYSNPLTQEVDDTRPATSTAIALTSGTNPSASGAAVTFTATVTGSAPSGNVAFFDGSTQLGTATLNGSNQAVFETSTLPPGWRPITARYLGDAANAPSTTPSSLFQTVDPPAGNGKLKVFILAGQSNMQGKAPIENGRDPNDYNVTNFPGGLGSLRNMLNREPNRYGYLADPANPVGSNPGWLKRSDVRVSYWSDNGTTQNRNGDLDPYFGNVGEGTQHGPDYGFGLVVGSHLGDQVLIIKYAFGGKSLAVDYRPPSSGGTVGPYYTGLVSRVNQVLADIPTYYPAYTGGGYEIAGFGWHQGWNDRNTTYVVQYEANLANLIRDLRTDLDAPAMPVVVANTGMANANNSTVGLQLIAAQTAVSNPTLYPEFAGTVTTVDTRPFDYGIAVGTSTEGFHWNRNAESYFNIGEQMGYAMMALQPSVVPGNSAPVFATNPIIGTDATEDQPYTANLAGSATDADNDPLTFTKVSGPAWLTVAPDGTLSGTPVQADVGANGFTISVSDGIAPPVEATLNITVNAAPVTNNALLVYEPFDYATGPLAGQSGGIGMTGVWADGPESNGIAGIFDETTATTPVNRTGNLSWDGVVNNLPTSPASGARYVALNDTAGDKWEAYRPLAQDAGTMAGPGKVLWLSMAWHKAGSGWGQHVGIALTTDSFTDRGKKLDTTGSHGSGAGNGIGVSESTINSGNYSAVVFNGGLPAAITTSNAYGSGSDKVLVLKFEFGEVDTVSAYAFGEDDTLTEIAFNDNKVSASAAVDENTLNMIAFTNVRGEPAFDEIRIGSTFESVIGAGGPANIAPSWATNPIIGPDATEDQPYTATLAGSATDAESDPLTYAKVSGPTWLTVAPDGTLSGTPVQADVGANSFTVSVTDGIAPAVEATLNITVNNVNDVPVFVNNPIIGPDATEDAPYTATLAGTATDANSDPLTYAKVSGPAWLSIAPNGTLSGTPSNSDVGANSFIVSVTDDIAAPVEATLNITVQSASGFVDTATAAGTLPVSGGSNWVLTFSDEFNGTTLNTSKWAVDISTQSRAPRTDRGIADWWWVEENVSLDGNGNLVLTTSKHDSDTMHCGSVSSDGLYEPRYGYLEARIEIADTTRDTHTAFWLQGPNMSNSDPADGTGNDGAEVDIFESAWFGDYTKSVVHFDGYGVNHQANTKQYSTPGLHVGYHVFGLEWTPNSMKIYYDGVLKVTYTGIWVPQVAEWLWLSTGASFGDIGDFATSPVGFLTSAKVDYVRVWEYDGNRAPYFVSDPVFKGSVTEGAAFSESMAGTALDDDDGDTLAYSKVSGPAWLSVAANGTLSGTPAAADAGINTWVIMATDSQGATATATLEIVVNALDGPNMLVGGALLNGNFNANPGTAVTFASTAVWHNTKGDQTPVATRSDVTYDGSQNAVLNTGRGFGVDTGHVIAAGDHFDYSYVWKDDWNWVDASDQVTVSLFTTSDNTITGTRTNLVVDASGLRLVNDAYESVSREGLYTATAAEAGKTLFAAIETTSSGFARLDNFVLSVTANQAPVFTANPINGAAATEDVLYAATLAGSATDAESDPLTFAKVSGPAWLNVAPDGTLSGTPTQSNVGPNSFTVSVSDGIAAPVEATLNIEVINVNDAPVFTANPINGAAATEDEPYASTLAGSATDDDGDPLAYAKVSGPAWLGVAPNGTLSGTPTQSDVGANTFTISVSDGIAAPVVATLNITVNNVNDVPVFVTNPITGTDATEGELYTATLAGSATDADGDPLTYAKVSGPAWLSVAANGSLAGTPTGGDVGLNSFTVSVTDGIAPAVTATLNITVQSAPNSPPVFLTNPIIAADASEGTAYTGVTLAGQATDPDPGDTITFSKVSGPAWLAVAPDGTLSGTPPTGSTGLNSFIVRATDSASATADATLEITVSSLPLPWITTDIGTGMLAGSASFNAGTFTLAGSGVIDGTSDSMRYTYQTLTGDGEITARIISFENTGNDSRIGVMIRDSLAANSKHYFMGMRGKNNFRWANRTSTGDTTASNNSGGGSVPDTWVRIVRSGTNISMFKSADGISWTTVQSNNNTTLGETCYIGLAVASGSTTTLNTSQFSNVSVTP